MDLRFEEIHDTPRGKRLKALLNEECKLRLTDELANRYLDPAKVVSLKRGEAVVDVGEYNPNVFIVMDGAFRASYLDGDKERTYWFATDGTMMFSWHSFYNREPAFYRIEACCDSDVLIIPKDSVDNLLSESKEFATWFMTMLQAQLFAYEKRNQLINGSSKLKLLQFYMYRSTLISKIPLSQIAAYLGITQQHLSRLRGQSSNRE